MTRPDRTVGSAQDHSTGALLPVIVVVVFSLLFVPGVFLGKQLFWSDTHLSFEPLRAQLGQALRAGPPLWSPWLGGGKTIIGNPTQATFYPPNLLFAVLPAYAALTLLSVAHLLLGAVGTLLLARRLTADRTAAVCAAVVFAGAGISLSAVSYLNLSWCTAWSSWLLLCVDNVTRPRTSARQWLALSAVVLLLITIAEPFVLASSLLGVCLWLVLGVCSPELPFGHRVRRFVVRPGSAALAAGVAAMPYLLAVINHFPGSVRALGFTWEGVTLWSLHPLRLLELVAPGAFGYLTETGDAAFWAPALFPGKGCPLLLSLYLGIPVLALVATAAARRSPRRLVLVVWLSVLLLLALGRWGPLDHLLELLPLADGFRFPVKWLVPAALPLALLAGLGVKDLGGSGNKKSMVVFTVCLVVAVLVLGVVTTATASPAWVRALGRCTRGPDGQLLPASLGQLFTACARGMVPALVLVAGLVAVWRRRLSPTHFAGLVCLVVATDLFTANRRLVPMTSPEFYRRAPAVVQVIRDDPQGHSRIWVDTSMAPPSSGWLTPHPTVVEVLRQQREMLDGYVATDYQLPLGLAMDTEATGPATAFFLYSIAKGAPAREQAMVLASAAVSHLVVAHDIRTPTLELLARVKTATTTTLRVYRNRLVQPRVRLVGRLLPYASDDGYRQLLGAAGEDLFSRVALVDAADLAQAGPQALALVGDERQDATADPGAARIAEDVGYRLRIIATAKTASLLVLADVWLPQWSATCDGAAVPVLRVNYCYRGVWLAPGDHEVVFAYHPWRR